MSLHKFVKLVISSVPVRKCYIEQMFGLVRMQLRNHVDTQTVKPFESAMRYIVYTRGVQQILLVAHITNFKHPAGPHEKISFLT